MVLVAPHTGSDAVFDFSSKFEKPGRKYWGIANVKVETIASIKKLSDDDLKTLWATFSGPDAVAAFHAGWDLASAGDGAVDYIRAHLADAPPPQTDPIDRLLVDLQDDQKRFVIMEKVRYRGEEIIPMLQAAQPTLPQGQVQYRVSTLLDQLKRYPDSPTETRARRVRHLLEIIGTPAAQMLANDIPDPDAGG